MEDEKNHAGRKNLIPPPYKIIPNFGSTKPPFHIDLSQDEKNVTIAVTQSNSDFGQAQEYNEARKLEDTQRSGNNIPETTGENLPESNLGYALIDSKDILPVKPENTFQKQQVSSNIPQNPFWPLYQEDASKLAYEAGKAQIEIGKTFALESIKTASSFERSQIRINEGVAKAVTAVNKQRLLYASTYEHQKNMASLKTKDVVKTGALKNNATMTRYIKDFIHDLQIVALTVNHCMKSNFYCLDTSRGIMIGHAPIDEKSLENLFKMFLREVVGEMANSYKFSDLFTELKDLIPIFGSKDCDLQSLKEEEQIFNNGIYNVKENIFRSFEENNRIFGQFPINVNFVDYAVDDFPATVFDEILDDVFDGDMNKIRLTYQILGAVMSNISLKHIFIFQGKSGAGKTTLTDIICSIIGVDKCLSIFDLSNLKDYTQEELNAYKLVVVKDTSDQAITPKQLSLLKNFADGNQRSSSNNFKVIINTNNSVYTSKDSETGVKYLSKALANRLVVMPFEKIMNKAYSKVDCDEYIKQTLYDEREHIISTAFKMFSLYYAKGENKRPVYQFCHEFPINAVIEDEVEIV